MQPRQGCNYFRRFNYTHNGYIFFLQNSIKSFFSDFCRVCGNHADQNTIINAYRSCWFLTNNRAVWSLRGYFSWFSYLFPWKTALDLVWHESEVRAYSERGESVSMARSHHGSTPNASRMHLRQGPDKLTPFSVPAIDFGYGNSGRT